MTDEPLDSRLIQWIAKTGFPFEMRVAQNLRSSLAMRNWDVYTNSYYLDDRSNEVREIDMSVYGLFLSPTQSAVLVDTWIILIVECKATSNPWVIFIDDVEDSRTLTHVVDFGDARRFWRYNEPESVQLRQFSWQFQQPLTRRPLQLNMLAMELSKHSSRRNPRIPLILLHVK